MGLGRSKLSQDCTNDESFTSVELGGLAKWGSVSRSERQMNRILLPTLSVALFLLLTPSVAFCDYIFQSALPGSGGTSGITIGGSSNQIYGAAFAVDSNVQVDAIGGYFFSQGSPFPDDIFGAIIRLSLIDAVPTGDPFSGTEVVASIVFNVGSTSANDVTVPLAVDLSPGTYAVVFGNDQFRATGVAAAPEAGAVQTSNYLVWNTDSGVWREGSGYSRFYVTGTVSTVPEPSGLGLCSAGILSILVFFRNRRQRSGR